MSAPAMRRPTGVRPVALEHLERQRGPHCWAALLLAGSAVYLRARSESISYEFAAALLATAAVFLPVVQNLGQWQQPVWDAAMPIRGARFALARLACGTALATFLLAVATGLHAVLFGIAGAPHPYGGPLEYRGWYPLTLLATGLTCYLIGAAVVLRARNEAIAMTCLFALYFLHVVAWPPVLLPFDPVAVEGMGVPELLARAAIPLGLAGAAAYAAARFPARAPAPAGPAARSVDAPRRDPARALPDPPPRRDPTRPLPDRPAPRPVRRGGRGRGRGRPTAALTVFRRHFALQRRFAVVPALLILVFAWLLLLQLVFGSAGEDVAVRHLVEPAELRGWSAAVALSWAVLIWLDERGAQRRWNDALPVGTARRRVLHAAAGAAWLLIVLAVLVALPLGGEAAVGILTSPADVPASLWLGLPWKALTLYLAATFVLFGTRVAHRVVPLLGPLLFLRLGFHIVESQVPTGAGDADPDGWSYTASALWLALYAAAAGGAIVLSDWIDRHHRLPRAGEAKGLLLRALGPVLSHSSTGRQP